MEEEYKREQEAREFAEKVEKNRLEAEERTRKNAEKRKKKKEKTKMRKQNGKHRVIG